MKKNQPSDTYKRLYDHVIEDILFQICNTQKYCVNYFSDQKQIPFQIWEKFEEYKAMALENMSGTRLDRHKIASCLCGAIIEIRPLVPTTNKYHQRINEIFALEVGINVIKFFMMCELLLSTEIDITHRLKTLKYLKEEFQMKFPSIDENICDTHEYKENLYNSLFWSHHKCDVTKKECFHYDIWAYAKIFYHLELYNKPYLNKAYQFLKEQGM